MTKLPFFLIFTHFFFLLQVVSADFSSGVDLTWGGERAKVSENGRLLQLSLDKVSGAGFQSKQEYLFGKIDMQIKVVPGNSAGTVTAYYLSSQGPMHDEIDFEFLGNASGEPYILHTNVYTQGKGNREQQFYLCFSVDGTPIRVFRNVEGLGVPYPKNQPMRLYSSLWCAEEWATRGGLIKTDWTQAPFTASYRNFGSDACMWLAGKSSCSSSKGRWWDQGLDSEGEKKLKWRAKVSENGLLLQLSPDKVSGAGFQSKQEYLFGKINMQINSASTVTAYYQSSQGPMLDEIDFEFLGNASGEPYMLYTNVYTQGKGNREQQFYLWTEREFLQISE
ncbi:hypothetical protein HHK36_032728 [Tetracentron sinense]|uniref:GH16 domain-containing protein n=1 Tax=Tetracentron sinense TaxID=13715 RepID=A0A834Y7K7_TETSI|nr:hypothetical protein HHK36_032728 [Tetracentron sinense]